MTTLDPEAPTAAAADAANSRNIVQGGILFGVLGSPFSRFAEAFRSIKVNIDCFPFSKASQGNRYYIYRPSEGKSTVAGNLAR